MDKNVKVKCVACGKKDLPTKSEKCRGCDPKTFYNGAHYPSIKGGDAI